MLFHFLVPPVNSMSMVATKTTVFLVFLWWIANGLTSLYSKNQLPNSHDERSFWEMKWLDLTIMQFLFGVVASVFWIFMVEKKSLNIPRFSHSSDVIAVLGNLFGHLSVNLSYSFVSSSVTQVVKSSEPLFMFIFLLRLGQRNMSARILFSIILMIFGTSIFVLWDATFNIWGIIAAVVSNIAFPLRNIALKNNDKRDQSQFQKYFILSFFGTLVLFPFRMLKLFFESPSPFLLTKASIGASTFHCVYNLASISGASVNVYCGTIKCLEIIKKLKIPRINGIFLVVPDVLRQTPLKEWALRHVLYKILAGLHYERYLTKALCLGHLWQYGGTFYLPSYKMSQRLTDLKNPGKMKNYWPCLRVAEVLNERKSRSHISLPPKDQRVQKQIAEFLRNMESYNFTDSPGIFQNTMWNALSRSCQIETYCNLTRNPKGLRDLYLQHGMIFEDDSHFGIISLDKNVGPLNRGNVGDEIQAIVGIQFLPFIDFFLDRDLQIAPDTNGKHTVFFNAWWGYKTHWPPPENIDPVMVSVHINAAFRRLISTTQKGVNFLKSKAPVGARDVVTRDFLEANDVQSFLSACMTLFLKIKEPKPIEQRENTIYIIDVADELLRLLPEWVVKKAKYISHSFTYGKRPTLITQERFVDAYNLLERYSQAKLVITRRIHAALPCVAMGTPVIFFNTPKLPGGGGSKVKPSARVVGITNLFHTVDLYNQTLKQAKEELSKVDWANPPRNPNLGFRMRSLSSMWHILRRNQAVYESTRRFGGLPLTPRWLTHVEHSQVFHVTLHDTRQAGIIQGLLSWYQWRCIESILRYHPTSRLFVYSNIIEQSTFDILTEVGYQITLRDYNVPKLVERTPLKEFFSEFEKKSSNELEKMLHEHGLLGPLLLYKYGGVYLDEKTIVLKALNNVEDNELSLDSKSEVNPWMLNFKKNHEFLQNVLEMFPTTYNPQLKPDGGKALLTKVCNSRVLRL